MEAYILISVTDADFDTQTRNLDGSVVRPGSLVKRANVNTTLSMDLDCDITPWCDRFLHIRCGFRIAIRRERYARPGCGIVDVEAHTFRIYNLYVIIVCLFGLAGRNRRSFPTPNMRYYGRD